MSEVNNENVQSETQGTEANDGGQEILIQEKKGVVYYLKKGVKYLLVFLGGAATALVGTKIFGGDDENDSAEAEAPKDE